MMGIKKFDKTFENDNARNILETYCESLGLRKGMSLWDLAYCVTSSLQNKIEELENKLAQKQHEETKSENLIKLENPIITPTVTPGGYLVGNISVEVHVNINEAVRLAQLPEVKAEIEKKQIKPGDWFVHLGRDVRKCDENIEGHFFGIKSGPSYFKLTNCRKIQSPELIALLNSEINK